MTKFTIQEVIDAAEKNGWEWRGNGRPIKYYDNTTNRLGQANFCVLEQANKNLGGKGNWAALASALDRIGVFSDEIWNYNDTRAKSYKDAAEYMKKILEPYIDKTITVNKKYF